MPFLPHVRNTKPPGFEIRTFVHKYLKCSRCAVPACWRELCPYVRRMASKARMLYCKLRMKISKRSLQVSMHGKSQLLGAMTIMAKSAGMLLKHARRKYVLKLQDGCVIVKTPRHGYIADLPAQTPIPKLHTCSDTCTHIIHAYLPPTCPTYLSYLPTYLPTYIPTYLPTCIHTYILYIHTDADRQTHGQTCSMMSYVFERQEPFD